MTGSSITTLGAGSSDLGLGNSAIGDTRGTTASSINAIEQSIYMKFGEPDDKQKQMIDSWDNEFISKMEGKLSFHEEYTNLYFNGHKLRFDKEEAIQSPFPTPETTSHSRSLGAVRALGLYMGITRKEMQSIFNLFKGNESELKQILNLKFDRYWTNESIGDKGVCGNFTDGTISFEDNFTPMTALAIHIYS